MNWTDLHKEVIYEFAACSSSPRWSAGAVSQMLMPVRNASVLGEVFHLGKSCNIDVNDPEDRAVELLMKDVGKTTVYMDQLIHHTTLKLDAYEKYSSKTIGDYIAVFIREMQNIAGGTILKHLGQHVKKEYGKYDLVPWGQEYLLSLDLQSCAYRSFDVCKKQLNKALQKAMDERQKQKNRRNRSL